MLVSTKHSTRTLKHYFEEVETLYSKVIESYLLEKKIDREALAISAEKFKDIQQRVMEFGALNTGAMYKAGIITGCVSALYFLKEKYGIEPNEIKG